MTIDNTRGAALDPRESPIQLWTIGHSRTSIDRFVELLSAAGVKTVVDVRSVPYSRHAPHASRERLRPALTARGLRYEYLGDQLGGRPADRALRTSSDEPDYPKMAASSAFRDGIEQLLALAASQPTCIMCSEEDPAHCHRTRLITPVLLERKVTVLHLRHDGRIEPHDRLF